MPRPHLTRQAAGLDVAALTDHESFLGKRIGPGEWAYLQAVTEQYDEPGRFTAFIGYEWTSLEKGGNLHRNVIFRGDASVANQTIPFSQFDSQNPEDLWKWLDTTSASTGAHFIAIPHNSNISQGLMFPLQDSEGNVISKEYAATRLKWEPKPMYL
mgnify:CR=1 FL=1